MRCVICDTIHDTDDAVAIEGLKHAGLERFFEKGDARRLQPEYVTRIRRILEALDSPVPIEALSRPAFRLHRLKGKLKGYWSVRVSANWRIVFRLSDGSVFDVDLVDYH